MITIIWGPPRKGKTVLMTHIAREIAFDRERTRFMQGEIMTKIANGFDSIRTIPPHCVSANYDMQLRKCGYRPRFNRHINPFKLGFSNPFVPVHFNMPYEAIFIIEAQKYLNSRMSAYFPDWQSRWYEQHAHNYLDIWLDTQRPMLIDVNVRDLAQFIEIIKLDKKYNKFGKICGLKWHVRIIENNSLFERYIQSGRTDTNCYTESIIEADYNVFECYDSRNCKPKFYDGHFDEDIDYNPALPLSDNIDAYIEYLQQNDDELPDGFYKRKMAS